jgi:hypothetical protein
VLVSKLPFVNLFSHLAGIVAPEYFENGEPSLEAGEYYKHQQECDGLFRVFTVSQSQGCVGYFVDKLF